MKINAPHDATKRAKIQFVLDKQISNTLSLTIIIHLKYITLKSSIKHHTNKEHLYNSSRLRCVGLWTLAPHERSGVLDYLVADEVGRRRRKVLFSSEFAFDVTVKVGPV